MDALASFVDAVPTLAVLVFILIVAQFGQYWGIVLSQWDLKGSHVAAYLSSIFGVLVIFAVRSAAIVLTRT